MGNKLLIGLNVDKTVKLWVVDESWNLDIKNSKIHVISSVNGDFLMPISEW